MQNLLCNFWIFNYIFLLNVYQYRMFITKITAQYSISILFRYHILINALHSISSTAENPIDL